MATELSYRIRDLISRRDLYRANADGARLMAERFDLDAAACNAEIYIACGEVYP